MSNLPLTILTSLLYLVASGMVFLHIRKISSESGISNWITAATAVAWVAAAFHLWLAYQVSFSSGALNFSLSSMAVLVSAIVVLLFLLGGLLMPIRRLGILVFPLTVLSLLFAALWGDSVTTILTQSGAFTAHILISIAAYALLAIASVQALLYVYQERQIKNRANPTMLKAMPPLQTMEVLLFRLVGAGFVLLTLTLLSGAFFSQQIFGYPFTFKHHTVLAIMGWLVFAILLYKRVRHGLRGSQAVAWTIGGFLLIQLGYFGTKIVSESLALQ